MLRYFVQKILVEILSGLLVKRKLRRKIRTAFKHRVINIKKAKVYINQNCLRLINDNSNHNFLNLNKTYIIQNTKASLILIQNQKIQNLL